MGRGGSSLDVLALLLLRSACECVRFSLLFEYSESLALTLLEYVIITSMFLYGVVQPGASVVLLTGVSGLAGVLVRSSESLQ